MFGFLLVVLILVGLFMGVVILLQSGKGGGLASMGGGAGTDTLIGGRQAATLLTKATWISGGLFMTLALVLSILSSRQAENSGSILRGGIQPAPTTAPQPILPGTTPEGEQAAPPAGTEAPATGTEGATTPAPTTGQ